jgi:hypothetical protein
MVTGERSIGEWGTLIGYEEFRDSARPQLEKLSNKVLSGITRASLGSTVHHPNGFLVNTLAISPDGQLRLHIWPTGRVDDLTPHSHPWHLASIVLAGDYVEYIPYVSLDDKSRHELMVPSYNDTMQQIGIQATQRTVSFELGQPRTYQAGEMHFLPAGVFHVTPLPTEKPFVTLVRTGPQLYDNPSFVKRETNQSDQLSVMSDRKRPTDDEIEIIWSQLAPIVKAD